jgi:hypothetical protein
MRADQLASALKSTGDRLRAIAALEQALSNLSDSPADLVKAELLQARIHDLSN